MVFAHLLDSYVEGREVFPGQLTAERAEWLARFDAASGWRTDEPTERGSYVVRRGPTSWLSYWPSSKFGGDRLVGAGFQTEWIGPLPDGDGAASWNASHWWGAPRDSEPIPGARSVPRPIVSYGDPATHSYVADPAVERMFQVFNSAGQRVGTASAEQLVDMAGAGDQRARLGLELAGWRYAVASSDRAWWTHGEGLDEYRNHRAEAGWRAGRGAAGVRMPQRSSALAHLREACEAAGDNDWPDDLHLGDAIEKHLNRYLLAADDGGEWTYARPVVAGCYWWQRIPGAPPVIVDLVCGAEGWYWCTPAMMRYSDKDGTRGRWSGPIAGPNAFDPWPAEPPK